MNELTKRAVKAREMYAKLSEKNKFKPWTDIEVYQGLVSDVGDLGRLVLAKEGYRSVPDVEGHLHHELAEILWATLLLGKSYGIDVEKAFHAEMDRVEKAIEKEMLV